MNKKRRLIIIIGAVIILLALIIFLNLKFKESVIKVETTVADFGSITSKVTGDGQLKAEAQVNIQSQIMGTVQKLFVKEGDKVKKGQILCLLEQTSAKANLASAQAQFEQAEQLYLRSETLYASKLIAQQDYETVKANYLSAKARLEQAQDNFNKTTITAPISGTVTQLNVEEGETVIIGTMNNLGTVLMVIADLTKMRCIVTIDETEVPTVRIGQLSNVTIEAFPDTIFEGEVVKVGYMPQQQTATTSLGSQTTDFAVEIALFETKPDLRPGMTLNAEIITSEKDSILVVPIQAVGKRKLKGEEKQTVFVYDKGVARLKEIKTGISSEMDIEIIEGLNPGDIVISGPYKVLAKLKEGDRVKSEIKEWQPTRSKAQSEVNPMQMRRQFRRATRVRR